eukprot:4928284-Pyramimonas_sp.AAC.1
MLKMLTGYASNCLVYSRVFGEKPAPSDGDGAVAPDRVCRTSCRCSRKECLRVISEVTVLRLRNQFQCAWADQDRALFELIHERRVCNHGCAIV